MRHDVALSGIDPALRLFVPSSVSGRHLRGRLNLAFADSLEHMLRACGGHVPLDWARLDPLLRRVRAGGRETPFLYALHFRLLDAIEADRLDAIGALIDAIADQPPAAPGILVTSLRADEFPWDADVVAGYFAGEMASVFAYVPPPAERVPPRAAQIRNALALIREAAPDLAGEIDELVTTVILAAGRNLDRPDRPEALFQGSSALRAFGAVMLDIEPHDSLVDCATTLIHEEAHLVLFALAPKEGVVTNADDERYASPLRDDPRPLEGIHHATFVLARMIFGLVSLRAHAALPGAERSRLEEILTTSRVGFHDGLATLRRHARLTAEGALALDAAEDYVERAFS